MIEIGEARKTIAATGRVGSGKTTLLRSPESMLVAHTMRLCRAATADAHPDLAGCAPPSAAVAIGLVPFVTGVALGLAWGSGSTARTVATADAAARWVTAEEGPAAVKDWDTLMRSNPIEALMAGCTEANLAVEDSRKVSRVWLFVDRAPALALVPSVAVRGSAK